MNQVFENIKLFKLLKENGFEFMRNWYYINSEDSMPSFELIEKFKNMNFNTNFKKELNEEQSLYYINSSTSIILGSVNILLIKN